MATSQTGDTARARFGWADGLRALAALSVLAFEIIRHVPGNHWSNSLLGRVALSTEHGFDALLVLSGLLLAYPVLDVLRREGSAELNVAAFAFGRALRILPAYYLVLAATALIPVAAATYGIGGLSHTGPSPRETALQALFFGNGLGNDGFAALAVQVRLLAVFPLLLAAYAFAPAIFALLAGVALYADYATPAHHWGAGAAPALMLGIVAADVLVRKLRAARFAWPLAGLSAAVAFALDPALAALPGPAANHTFMVWNPLWAVAAAALAVACARSAPAERIFAAHGFRELAGASFALVLVADPIATFVLGHAASAGFATALSAAGMALAAAFGLWSILDRSVTASRGARALVRAAGRRLGHAATISLGAPRPARVRTAVQDAPDAPFDAGFGALPTMHPGMLATVVQRVGSVEDLQAEIEAVKRRLAETASGATAFSDAPALLSVPEQLVLARESLAHEDDHANEAPLEGVLLPPVAPNPRKVVTLALGTNRPRRSSVRVSFGPTLEGARAS